MAGRVGGRVTEALKLGLGLGKWRCEMGKENRVGKTLSFTLYSRSNSPLTSSAIGKKITGLIYSNNPKYKQAG